MYTSSVQRVRSMEMLPVRVSTCVPLCGYSVGVSMLRLYIASVCMSISPAVSEDLFEHCSSTQAPSRAAVEQYLPMRWLQA